MTPERAETEGRPDVIVTWLQNDYGRLGRAAESIAHALLDEGLAGTVAYCEPGPVTPGKATMNCAQDRGLRVYQHQGDGITPAVYATTVLAHAGMQDPIVLNCGVGEQNWWFHAAFAPCARFVTLVTHDILDLWPGLDQATASRLVRIRSHLIRGSDQVVGLSVGSTAGIPAARYVGHGCDAAWEDPAVDAAPCPPDLDAIPHPRALYLGSLSTRIEVKAMQALADAGVHVVLVGFAPSPEVGALIETHSRVHFLGPRAPSESPPYLLHSDVGVVPHTDEPFTATMEPHKVYNYACAGLRGVTLHCALPPALDGVVDSTHDVDAFVENTLDALGRGRLTSAERDGARRLTWRRVARRIMDGALV